LWSGGQSRQVYMCLCGPRGAMGVCM